VRPGWRSKGLWDAMLDRTTLVLRDGRRLTYFVDGPPEEVMLLENDHLRLQQNTCNDNDSKSNKKTRLPHIICFHAMFLSGNSFLMKHAPKDYVMVCVNRPGYFGSDPPPTPPSIGATTPAATTEATSSPSSVPYTYRSFAQDIEQLADHLGLDTFYVAGHSSGGPCSLACAAYLPKRVLGVGILSGDPEYAHADVPNKRQSSAFLLGWFLPRLLKYCLCFLPMARNGIKGLENDYRLEMAAYSFRTETIAQPTTVFVGETDTVMPLEVSRHVHRRLQNGTIRTIPKVGHLGLLRDDVLHDLFTTMLNVDKSAVAPAPASPESVGALLEMI
jgi:pimeloyl-ACP methyl ester carboxylesterase